MRTFRIDRAPGQDYRGAMQQWLFVSSSGQQFTANEPDVPALVQSGQIGAQTLMWREGMPQWMPAASVFPLLFSGPSAATQPMVTGPAASTDSPALAGAGATAATRSAGPAAVSPASEALVRRLVGPLFDRKGWIKLLGVMMIIGGILSIPYLGLGLLPLFAGIALMKMAGSIDRAQSSGDVAALEESQRHAARFFFLYGVFIAIALSLSILMMILLLLTSGAAIFSGMKGMNEGGMEFDHSEEGGPTIDDISLPPTPPSGDGN
ncbi:MAG: DUF5362 family protein [Verrucomicrobiales bacterium]